MQNVNILPNLVIKDEYTNLLSQKQKYKMSPVKGRESVILRKSIKPLSSSQFKQKKPIQTKQDLAKINSKLQMIKSKVMKLPKSISKSDQFHNQFLLNQQLDDSVDQDQGQPIQKLTKIHLLKSKFQDRPSTIFFMYPKCCGLQSRTQRVFSLQKVDAYYKIAGSQYRCIVSTLQFNGFQKVQSGLQWNVFFDVSGIHHQKALQNANKYQKINHFPGCWQLGRKDYMWKNLTKQRRAHPQAYNFVPTTYIFPGDFDRFQIARQNASKDQLWILKPTNQACGRGIKMITKQSQLRKKKDVLVSEYIANPHLINNFKYDLRIYVLVTSYDPLRIYLFNEGLVRFATYQYNTKAKDVKKRFIHLTNFSVNKHSKKFVKNKKAQQDGQGSKWSLTALKNHFQKNQINTKAIFDGIKDIIIKTCISAQPLMLDLHSKTQEKRNCGFQIYGFDILIDSKLKPWLMQVNVCPSLASSSPMDRKIKYTLLTDTLNLLGLQHYSRKGFEKEKKKQKLRFQQKQEKKIYSRNVNNLEVLNYNNCVQLLSPDDWLVLFESCQQLERKGNFQRIFPLRNNIDTYKPLFEFSRYNNNILWKYLKSEQSFIDKLYA